jgi:cell volume regulation protein A
MELTVELAILVSGVLLLAGVLASRLSDALGMPAMLLFLVLGMFAGSEGVGGIQFESHAITQAVGTGALLVILFSGALETQWSTVKPVLVPGILLATLGVITTTLLLGTFAWFMLGTYTEFSIGTTGITWLQGLLLAAIVSSTDAAAVFSVFRTSAVQPNARLRYLLEFESGSNDPMAVLLTTLILGIITSGASASAADVAVSLILQFVGGAVVGGLTGWTSAWLVNRVRLSARGLYPILVLACGMLAFGLAHVLGGNGFLAVYTAGVLIGNTLKVHQESIIRFHDGLGWLMQIVMFVVLGLLIFPSQLLPVAKVAISIAMFLIFIARPISVFLCLAPLRTTLNDMGYISWVGLRGSVPIVLATFPVSYHVAGADAIFNIIFFIVLTSVLVQGVTLVPSCRWFGVVERPNTHPPT